MPINRGMNKKIWYIYIVQYYSAIKGNEIVYFAQTWIDIETVIQSKTSKKEKNKYCIISLICEIQKSDTDELICKAEIETETQRMDIQIPGREGEGGWQNTCNHSTVKSYEIWREIRMRRM